MAEVLHFAMWQLPLKNLKLSKNNFLYTRGIRGQKLRPAGYCARGGEPLYTPFNHFGLSRLNALICINSILPFVLRSETPNIIVNSISTIKLQYSPEIII